MRSETFWWGVNACAVGGILGIASVTGALKTPLGSFATGFFFGVALCAIAAVRAIAGFNNQRL